MADAHAAPRPMPRTAAALVIGNELLSGKIADANVVELARALRALGVLLCRVVMVPDELEVIAGEVRALGAAHDLVFTSGGIGPTHDDLTIAAVARALGVKVVRSPELERMLRAHYGAAVTEGHLRMAQIPEGARLARHDAARWPAIVAGNVWLLPGIPEVFRMKLPIVEQELGRDRPFVSRAVYTTLDEGHLAPILDRLVADHPAIDVGSYPRWSDPTYRTKLTLDGQDEVRVRAACDALLALLPAEGVVRVE